MTATPSIQQQERLMQVILAPVISEKSTFVADKHQQVIFRVAQDATKPEVKAAVEAMFKVEVKSVQIANVGGKKKRFGRFTGQRRSWKKAYVCLKPGQEINITMPVILPRLQTTQDVAVDGVTIPGIQGAQIQSLSTVIPDAQARSWRSKFPAI